jgi:hypothetical protein
LQSDQQLRSETGQEPDDSHGRLATYRLDELHPHPSYSRHGLAVSASQLSALAALHDQTLEEPIAITQDGLIIDGYARVERARMLGRTSMLCIEYDRTEEEALRDLLQRHLGSNRLNAFCRILLARELEPWFKKKALANQIAGGENKVSSKLTEAERVSHRTGRSAHPPLKSTTAVEAPRALSRPFALTNMRSNSRFRTWSMLAGLTDQCPIH